MSEESEIIIVISARKYALYERIKTELVENRELQEYDGEELQAKLRQAISTLPNMMFLSEKERKTKKVMPGLRIEDIGIDQEKVIERISKFLST